MEKHHDVTEGKYYVWSSKIMSYLITTICFILAIIPALLGFLFLDRSLSNIVLFGLFGLFIGPAWAGMLGSILEVQKKNYEHVFKRYFQIYFRNFSDAFRLTAIYITTLIVSIVDVAYVQNTTFAFTSFFFLALIVVATVIYAVVLPISVKFSFDMKSLLRLGMTYLLLDLKNVLKIASYVFLLIAFFMWISESATIFLSFFFSIMVLKDMKLIFSDIQTKFILQETIEE